MNNETIALLEKHFDVAFAAPDGIKKLRELILTLAMQGKLVPQDPNDQPASELLKEIEAEKKRLVKDGKIKQPKPLPEIKPEENLSDLPHGWKWVRLGEIIIFTNGYAFKSDLFQATGIGIIKIGDISGGLVSKNKMDFIDGTYIKEIDDKFQAKLGDLLIAMSGATTGKLGFNKLNEVFFINQRVGKIEPILNDKNYLYNFLSTQIQKNLTISSGSAIPNLSTEQINETLIPLPPLAEQRRIVAKIDELMARCDELEKLKGDRHYRLTTVHTDALNRLLMAKESSDFSTAWNFITQHFGELYSIKENVAELRKAILQLAVMGKLVPQDPTDEPASMQFKHIRQHIDELVRKKTEKEVKFKYMNPNDEKFVIPENWLWVKLGSLLISLKYGTSKKCEYNSPGTAVLRIPNIDIDLGCIDIEKLKYTNLLKSELEDLYLMPNDLLIIRSNGSLSLVGRTAVISEAEEGLAYAGYLVRLRSFPKYVYSRYLYFALNTVFVRDQIEQPIRSTSGVKNINSTEIANISIPLPPLAEQHRIVGKIDQLMGLCDRLEQQVDNATSKQNALLNVVMTKL
jgi:type I restriction enzyme, S subunit